VPQQGQRDHSPAKGSRELDRLQKLLEDAVPLLMDNFARVAELAAAQYALLEEALGAAEAVERPGALVPAAGVEASRAADWRALARGYDEHIRHHLNSAVIALQFDDMAIQLIAHIRERLGHLEGGEAPAQAGVEACHPRTYGPVSADGLSSGSVDLF
jgi:hypothetical protein